jgi:hypothetical protein
LCDGDVLFCGRINALTTFRTSIVDRIATRSLLMLIQALILRAT